MRKTIYTQNIKAKARLRRVFCCLLWRMARYIGRESRSAVHNEADGAHSLTLGEGGTVRRCAAQCRMRAAR